MNISQYNVINKEEIHFSYYLIMYGYLKKINKHDCINNDGLDKLFSMSFDSSRLENPSELCRFNVLHKVLHKNTLLY